MKINFGCGSNRLPGWQNHDKEIDISQRLPYADNSASHIFSEHCVEHIPYYDAINFFKECARVLAPGGIIRIAVPSLEQIMNKATPAYCKFVRKWAPDESVRGALHAILYSHGHKAAWTESLLEATLFYCGFKNVTPHRPGSSPHAELSGVEGHGKIIGDDMNNIETVVVEAVKDGVET